jgi:non-heme chloroperoxidase
MNASRDARLEVVSRLPGKPARQTPLLFVHGAFTAAWCWDEHFLNFFADAGYAAHALSLSGHGRSAGREHLDSLSIDDYVNDVVEVMAGLPVPPVLVGHSMGGFVVQKVLERQGFAAGPLQGEASHGHGAAAGSEHPSSTSAESGPGGRPSGVPGAVLMCSVPPQGLVAAAFGMLFSRPSLLKDLNRMMSGKQVSLDALSEALFAQPVMAEDLQRYYRLAQAESHRALWDMSLFNLPHPSRIDASRLLILGTEYDHLIPASLVEMTARAYGIEAMIFPAMGHGLMLEQDWEKPARHVLDWLEEGKYE